MFAIILYIIVEFSVLELLFHFLWYKFFFDNFSAFESRVHKMSQFIPKVHRCQVMDIIVRQPLLRNKLEKHVRPVFAYILLGVFFLCYWSVCFVHIWQCRSKLLQDVFEIDDKVLSTLYSYFVPSLRYACIQIRLWIFYSNLHIFIFFLLIVTVQSIFCSWHVFLPSVFEVCFNSFVNIFVQEYKYI